MADFSEITQEINEQITTNGQRAITGAKLNTVLRDMVSAVNDKKQDPIQDLSEIRRGAAFGATALQSEQDPTVPSWAKQANKPSYDYSEIGNTPDLSGFITKSVNDLTNYYLKSETYTKAEVAALIGAIQQFHYEIYPTLPQSGQSNVLYLIGPTGSGADKYEEYVYANNDFTKIGDTSIDLSGYVTTSALNTALADYTTTANLTALLSYKADKSTTPNVLTVSDITQLTSEQCESLRIGDIVVTGMVSYLVTTLDNTDIYLSCSDSDTITTVIYSRDNTSEHWQYFDTTHYSISTKPNKPLQYTNGHLATLDLQANLTDSGKSVSDFATAAQGALADTAYQKPSTGIPASDLESGVIPQPEVFVATVGSTTYQEVTSALNAGKVVIAVEGDKTYYYVGIFNNEYYFFTFLSGAYSLISLDSEFMWGFSIPFEVERVFNKVTSISSSSTDTQYPSAKCVYDALLDYVQKSQTVGLLKNDGTVDTNTYLTQQDIIGKADKTSVVTLTGTSVTQELADNTIYQGSELGSLTITIPNGITPDYISQINFESGNTATTLTAPNTIVWFGDDLTNNVFVPTADKQYVVMLYSDGVNVRGVVQSYASQQNS